MPQLTASLIILLVMMLLFAILQMVTQFPNPKFIFEYPLFEIMGVDVDFIFLLDFMSVSFALTVILISLSVFIFSKEYMKSDKFSLYFYNLLFIFVISMILLIFSPGVLSMLLGWEGLGASSFLLVLFYSNTNAFKSSKVTFLINRLGDGCIFGALIMGYSMGSFNLALMKSPLLNNYTAQDILLILFLTGGAFTKSAQFPSSAWLPMAMAAPTPVSSLVHSSTLVASGVYILIRVSPFLSYSSSLLLKFGIITSFIAGMSAVLEADMKKVIALSTLSQLGFMVSSLGAEEPMICYFHLVCHAYFKALMFISAGNLMMSISGYQHMKFASGAIFLNPLAASFLITSTLSLCSIPFFSGFYSKELIVEMCIFNLSMMSTWFILSLLSMILTIIYSIRLASMINVTCFKNPTEIFFKKLNPLVLTSSVLLFFPAVMIGSMILNILTFELAFIPFTKMAKIFVYSSSMVALMIYFKIVALDNLFKSKDLYPLMTSMNIKEGFSNLMFMKILWNTLFKSFKTPMPEMTAINNSSISLALVWTPTFFQAFMFKRFHLINKNLLQLLPVYAVWWIVV